MTQQANTNAVVERQTPVAAFIAEVLPPIKRSEVYGSLPAHVKPERFERNLANAIMREPKIMQVDPRVVYREVSKIAALGLLLDPQLGECYLIVDRNNDIQARVGYRGLIKLSRQSGEISTIYAVDICEYDPCEIVQGTERRITHKPDYTQDRGDAKAYYAIAEFKDGTKDFEVMSAAEIYKIRDRSDAWRAFKAGKIKSTPWGTDDGEMSKKTVLRRLLKRCPMSPELADLLASEDRADERDMRDVTPTSNLSGIQARLAAANATAPIDIEQHVDRETGEILPPSGAEGVIDGAAVVEDDVSQSIGTDDAKTEERPSSLTPDQQGRAHYHAGMTLRQMPSDIKGTEAEADFVAGFNAAKFEATAKDEDGFPGDRP